MPEYKIYQTFSNAGTQNEVRMRVINELSKETAGTGAGNNASRYTYFVEQLNNGSYVYLRRPANLHYGFDFVVCVENINFNPYGRKRNYPTHGDIIDDLHNKYIDNPHNYKLLFLYMEQIYNCKDIDYSSIQNITFSVGYPVDMIVKILKWLFIEQDIRYWNYSGRNMLWNDILQINH